VSNIHVLRTPKLEPKPVGFIAAVTGHATCLWSVQDSPVWYRQIPGKGVLTAVNPTPTEPANAIAKLRARAKKVLEASIPTPRPAAAETGPNRPEFIADRRFLMLSRFPEQASSRFQPYLSDPPLCLVASEEFLESGGHSRSYASWIPERDQK
jgi:hypothetical protein